MNIFITGGSGFVGTALSDAFLKDGHSVAATGTRPIHKLSEQRGFTYIQADTSEKGGWQDELKNADAVVNLAGRTIFHFWTDAYKKSIRDSRILTTRNIVNALPDKKNIILCSTSAAGYYGNRGDEKLTESSSNGDDFLAGVCREWETEALAGEEKGARVAIMRFGVVLGKNGGAMQKMLPAYRFGLGGPLGGGMQWFPWIHLDDLVAAVRFILDDPNIGGAVNFTAPDPVRNADFAKTLGRMLNRPAFMPAPAFFVRLFLREFGDALMASQRAVPDKLQSSGFRFRHPGLESALAEILE